MVILEKYKAFPLKQINLKTFSAMHHQTTLILMAWWDTCKAFILFHLVSQEENKYSRQVRWYSQTTQQTGDRADQNPTLRSSSFQSIFLSTHLAGPGLLVVYKHVFSLWLSVSFFKYTIDSHWKKRTRLQKLKSLIACIQSRSVVSDSLQL